jgi:glutaredoxin
VLRRTIPALLAVCLAPNLASAAAAAAAAPDPLAAARAHLKAGKFDLIIDDLADTSQLAKEPAAQVFADAAEMAQAKSDRSFAGLYCERAIALDAKQAKALRTCATVAVQEKRFEQAERFGDALGALLPKDGEVALLRAQAAQGLEGWQMVVVILEPFEGDKAVGKRVAPLLAQARAKVKAPEPAAPAVRSHDATEAKLAAAVKAARELDRKAAESDEAAAAERKKKWRPMGEKVVLYTIRQCGSCDSVRAWLQEHEVEFEEKDADRSGQAWREAIRICTKARQVSCVVPIVVVNGEAVSGFDVVRLQALLNL